VNEKGHVRVTGLIHVTRHAPQFFIPDPDRRPVAERWRYPHILHGPSRQHPPEVPHSPTLAPTPVRRIVDYLYVPAPHQPVVYPRRRLQLRSRPIRYERRHERTRVAGLGAYGSSEPQMSHRHQPGDDEPGHLRRRFNDRALE
jgi:hypothetical protein